MVVHGDGDRDAYALLFIKFCLCLFCTLPTQQCSVSQQYHGVALRFFCSPVVQRDALFSMKFLCVHSVRGHGDALGLSYG